MARVFFLFLCFPVLYFSCNSGRHVSNFSNVKQSIDTIEVLPIDIRIKTADYNKIQLTDPQLEKLVNENIYNLIVNTLNTRYKVASADTSFSYKQLCTDLERMRFFIETQPNPLDDQEVPFSFYDVKTAFKHRYILVLIVRSQYCINYPNRMAVWSDPAASNYINQYVYLIDSKKYKIVYYKKTYSDSDISLKSQVEQITLENLRNIYYK